MWRYDERVAEAPVVPVNHRQQKLLSFFFFPCGSQKCLWSRLFPRLVECQVAISHVFLHPVPSGTARRGTARCMRGDLRAEKKEHIKKKKAGKNREVTRKMAQCCSLTGAKHQWEKLSE